MASTFHRARRRGIYDRLARVIGASDDGRGLLPLEEATTRLRPFERRYVGLRAIPVSSVVGTEGRVHDFDREFVPRRRDIGPRLRSVAQAFPEGDFPPIVVYRLGEAYFVVDGHHRVAIARRRGMATIDAEVTELRARWRLPADADPLELIHADQEWIFMHESGLARTRPEVQIRFTRPVGYVELLENVQLHGYHLMQREGRVVPPGDIAADWYENVYLPTVDAIKREGLDNICPGATYPDRYLWVYHRRRELVPEHGLVPVDESIRLTNLERARERRLMRRLLSPRAQAA